MVVNPGRDNVSKGIKHCFLNLKMATLYIEIKRLGLTILPTEESTSDRVLVVFTFIGYKQINRHQVIYINIDPPPPLYIIEC